MATEAGILFSAVSEIASQSVCLLPREIFGGGGVERGSGTGGAQDGG